MQVRNRTGAASWRRVTRSSALICAVGLVLAACSGDGGDDGEAEAGEDGGGGDGTVVTVWFNGESIPADEFAALEEEHGITVEWDIRGDAILTDMLRMRDAGQPLPDLVEIDSNLTPAFLEAGLLAPMTEQIATWEEEDPDLYAEIPESVWRDGEYDGEIYHYPNKSLVDALFYNINILEEAGVEPPPYDTYEDLLDAARAVQEANPDLPAYFGTGGGSPDRMFRWLYSFGVPWGGEQGNIPDLTSPQGVEMLTWLQTMYEEGITDPEFVIGQQDESKGAFVSGDLPFIEEGLNGGPGFMLDDFVYGEDWATAPYPVHEGGAYIGVPRGWSMSADVADPYAASLVLRYLSEREIAAERYLELESGIVQSIPVLEEDIPEAQPFFTPELLDIFMNLEEQIPPGTNTASVAEILGTLLEEVNVTGTDASPEEIAEKYQAELDALG